MMPSRAMIVPGLGRRFVSSAFVATIGATLSKYSPTDQFLPSVGGVMQRATTETRPGSMASENTRGARSLRSGQSWTGSVARRSSERL